MKSGKMVKSLEFLFLQSYNKCFISEFFFVLVSSYSISPLRLVGNALVMFCYVCMFCCAVRVHCLKTDNNWNTSIIKYLE